MAAKKYYAVKKGKTRGIFRTWEECRASVEGCSGAEYKGFGRLEEAEAYLGLAPGTWEASGHRAGDSCRRAGAFAAGSGVGERKEKTQGRFSAREVPESREADGGSPKQSAEPADAGRGEQGHVREGDEIPAAGTLLAYVDGSYDNSLKKYAFGCVFILPDGRIFTEYGNGDNEQSLRHRNVTGEMLGAMYAVKTAMASGFSKVELCYDYEGIEKWVTGAWRSKTELTKKYAVAMGEWRRQIEISFRKVAAHTNVYYNELADQTAKAGLRDGSGIPKVRSLV
ncbi:MAG: RNAse H family protein [Lachnospiraceae bacterium]|nr:RNAse H family protein [Lachnospiraceae bacterium]